MHNSSRLAALSVSLIVLGILGLLSTVGCAQTQPGYILKTVSRAEISGRPRTDPPIDLRSTVYVSGPNHRIERVQQWYRGVDWRIVHIARCADRVDYELNLDTKEYIEQPQVARDKNVTAAAAPGAANVVFDVTTVDTGETKKIFGHTAHRYLITTTQTESPELGGRPSETREELWLLDIPDVLTCRPGSHRPQGVLGGSIRVGGQRNTPQIRPEFHYRGPDPQGLAVSTKRTTVSHEKYVYGEPYDVTSTFTTEITELKHAPVDPALFEVPRGFTKVKNFTAPGR